MRGWEIIHGDKMKNNKDRMRAICLAKPEDLQVHVRGREMLRQCFTDFARGNPMSGCIHTSPPTA